MRNSERVTRQAVVLAFCAALAACGGGGGDGGATTPAAATAGTASKGVLENALVTAYAISGGAKGARLAEARTDVNGKYSLSLGSHDGPVLLELTVDSSSLMTCDIPAGCSNGETSHAFGAKFTPQSTLRLQSVLAHAKGKVSSAITPFTYLAAQLALENGGSAADIDAALTQVSDLFGLPSLNATQPVDITAADLGSSLDAQRYAVMNAAIAQLGGSDLVAGLDSLVAEIKKNNGQLEKDNVTAAPSLTDVLAAASDVVQSSSVSAKLNSLIAVAISTDLANVEGRVGELTEASPAPLPGASDLAKAKAFVASTHDIIQSLRGYGSTDDVLSELQGRYASLQAFSGDEREAHDVHRVANAVFGFTAAKAAAAARDGLTGSFDAEDVQAYFDDEFGFGTRFRLQAATGTAVTIDAANRTVSFSGTVKVQEVKHWWCDVWPYDDCPASTPIGVPTSYEISNITLKYPDVSAVKSSFTAEILGQGYIQGEKSRLKLQGSGPNLATFTYASSAALSTHLDAYSSSATAANHLPEKVEVGLKNVVFAVGSNLSSPDVTFTGSVGLRANKASLKTTDPTSSSSRRTTLVPTLATFNGSFAGLQGDKVDAVLAVEISSPYDNQILVSPGKGYIRPGLFSYSYDAGTGVAKLKLNLTQADKLWYDYWGWSYKSREIKLRLEAPVTSGSYGDCEVGQRPITYFSDWGYGESWNTLSCTTESNLPAALSALDWSRGNTTGPNRGYLKYFFGADILYGGLYLPKSPAGFSYGSETEVLLAGEVVDYYDEYVEDSAHYAKGSVSAKLTVHATLNGKPLDVVTDLTAQRLSYQGGDAKLVLTVNGQTITLSSPVNAGVPLFQLSDKNGASVVLLPGSSGADSAITINGKTMGYIKRLGGAYVVRFVDNSLLAL